MADGKLASAHGHDPLDAIADTAPPSRAAALELARAAGKGDALATRRLLATVAPRVLRAVKAVMGRGHPELDDAAQLALIGFIQALPGFRGECDPSQFAARIAVRTAGALRRRSRTRSSHYDAAVDPDGIEGPRETPDAERRREVIRGLLDQLPPEQAEALALRIMLGWTLDEIATTSGTPLNTVRSRLRLAKESLRRRIAADGAMAEALGLTEQDR
jgi:RNA polymerase sigma-70 factor, ECF subfamily